MMVTEQNNPARAAILSVMHKAERPLAANEVALKAHCTQGEVVEVFRSLGNSLMQRIVIHGYRIPEAPSESVPAEEQLRLYNEEIKALMRILQSAKHEAILWNRLPWEDRVAWMISRAAEGIKSLHIGKARSSEGQVCGRWYAGWRKLSHGE